MDIQTQPITVQYIVKQLPSHLTHSISCQDCRMGNLCLPLAVDESERHKLDQFIQHKKPLQPRDKVFQSGDAFTSIYAVRSGSFKSFCLDSEGREQVTGFYLPGEIFGWDGLADDQYQNTTIALETSSVCEIPYEKLEQLGNAIPAIKKHVMKLISREINADQKLITLLAGHSAQQKVASLLLSFSDRLAQQKRSPTRLWLPMSRSEISSYLGLTVETVSRVLGALQKKNLLNVNRKEIEILDKQALQTLAASADE